MNSVRYYTDLLENVEPYQHAVRHCHRCDTVVEPRLSLQWFVKMAPLAEPAGIPEERGDHLLVLEGAPVPHGAEEVITAEYQPIESFVPGLR